jgi:hypothetical protein
MKKQIKQMMNQIGISKNSTIFRTKRNIFSTFRNLRIQENSADKFGYFSAKMIPRDEFQAYWAMLRPYSNGHQLVRIGSKGDGGYLVPNDMEGIKFCFSPGAGAIWTFEEALGELFGIESFVCDGTIEKHPAFPSLRSFIPKNVGLAESENVISFESWVGNAGEDSGDLLLQMDIEGAEYPILSSIDAKFLTKFRTIVLELHDLHLLAIPSSFTYQYSQLMSKLLANFDLVHLHPNAWGGGYIAHGTLFPRVVEITLHRKDRSRGLEAARIPHELDFPNDHTLGEFPDFSFIDWFVK